ncbi:hypothetical protein THASP1DRAFT_28481 [Thamnocephalis sphaerospora]|uniref:Uncharacterized protein n=1 Tax=Thamnocephalis sphaerospora TaxID=78915 RepID=A0A4P9XVR5_9FUNG|nr:hypothetical protein THASP1DRAFT_28481 [Thamnocephalis sphaerospora]|eukprot:RKP09711.1 hypothetical protein THASP1DRAFT_28481 [Thamnocephalis sphaerospora]
MSQALFASTAVAAPVAVGLLPDARRHYGLTPAPATAADAHNGALPASTPVPMTVSLPLDISVPKTALRRRNAVVEAMLEGNVLAALSAVRGQPEPSVAA